MNVPQRSIPLSIQLFTLVLIAFIVSFSGRFGWELAGRLLIHR